MVNFNKRLGKTSVEKKTNPVEIYESLDRKSEIGPLRPSQLYVLNEWHEKHKDKKNNVIKLHTGEGKTLIGLLILNSKLNAKSGPCLYVCPNIYLFEQTCLEAERFGVPFCIFEGKDMPEDFVNSEKILITYVQKIFYASSSLGIDSKSIQVGTIILDDSHACIDSIKDSFCIKTKKEHPLYKELITLFEDDLASQGEGTFIDIKGGEYSSFLPIPYWAWFDRQSEVVQAIAKYKSSDEVKFVWSLIKDSIDKCQAFISGNNLEIVPYFTPIHKYGFFHNARNRILMSATTQDDSFFVLGLDFDIESVKNPIIYPDLKWSGEKMIVIPSLINEELDRDLIIQKLAVKNEKKTFGIVALTSSFKNSEQYKNFGAKVARKNIKEIVRDLKSKKFEETIVFANSYDGIDLPDETCRILIIDSKPFFNSLSDKYEEFSRPNSDTTNIRVAQKVEQGLGRSVRGEKDYSAIVLLGSDLVKFMKSSSTNSYFSMQTRKQIEIGLMVAGFAKEDLTGDDDNKPYDIFAKLLAQVINRDKGWKEFYKEEMEKIELPKNQSNIMSDLKDERDAEAAFFFNDYQKACEKMQRIVDKFNSKPEERGWYLQSLARMKYNFSKTDSNDIQKSAFLSNRYLLKPKSGISYEKISIVEDNRLKNIRDWINKSEDSEDLLLTVNNILSDFSFGVEADKFEQAVKDIGTMLGFTSQRPDKEYKKGPDNLWCGVKNEYIFYECKSEVLVERPDIIKSEAGQMNSHCGWFEEQYGDSIQVKRVLIHPTKKLSYYANLTHEVKVMRRGMLKELKTNILSFFKECLKHNIGDITDSTMSSYLANHRLDFNSLFTSYCEDIVTTSKL